MDVSWQELKRIRGVLARHCSIYQLPRQMPTNLGAPTWEVTEAWGHQAPTTRGWLTVGEARACRAGLRVGFPHPQPQTPGNSQKFPGTCFQLLHSPHSESSCLGSGGWVVGSSWLRWPGQWLA